MMRGQTMKKDISQKQIKVINAVSTGYKMIDPDADDFGIRVFCLEAMDSATAEQIEDMAAFVRACVRGRLHARLARRAVLRGTPRRPDQDFPAARNQGFPAVPARRSMPHTARCCRILQLGLGAQTEQAGERRSGSLYALPMTVASRLR